LPETIQQPVGTIGKYALSVNALAHRLQHLMLACGLFLLSPPELVELPTAWKPNLPRCKRRKANSLLHPPVSQQHSQASATTSRRQQAQHEQGQQQQDRPQTITMSQPKASEFREHLD